MAGKKKKSLANKLAKMSDEERARYIQHKADMEEEAKRRKEQLIATFMKKKIKKEDAFSRLNLAKINQNWHQILRKIKCQEMKAELGHLQEWIERLLKHKDRMISNLLEELEEAEEQYSHNFQSHSMHIDKTIDFEEESIEQLQKEYEEEINELLEASEAEEELISKNAGIEHLKTVFYRQETEGNQSLVEDYERYMLKICETEYEFQAKMDMMEATREAKSAALWRQIATVVRMYVRQTDARRMRLAELKRSDAESAVEVARNEEDIKRKEDLISQLEKDYESMTCEREATIKKMELELQDLSKTLLRVKKNLQKDLQTDEKQINLVSHCGANTVKELEKIKKRGEHLKNLANTCKKFETEREKICKWIPLLNVGRHYEEIDVKESARVISEHLKEIGNKQKSLDIQVLPTLKVTRTRRPNTALPTVSPKPALSKSIKSPEALKENTIESFLSSSPSCSSIESSVGSKGILEKCFDSLQGMENFWFTFNKVELDYLDIKEEKRVLEEENKKLRGVIRAVLEAAALSQSVPNSTVSTRVASRRRGIHSAPIRRSVF